MNRQIVVIGKRWFEKTNGNTYHSVAVYVDGELAGRERFVYGYGNQYEQTALHLLTELGIYTERDAAGRLLTLHRVVEDNGDSVISEVADVARK